MLNLTLFGLLVVLQVLDVLSTNYIITKQGGSEANPIMRFMMRYMGLLPALIVPKLVWLGLIWWAGNPWLTSFSCVAFIGVIISNVLVIKKLKAKHK